MQLVGVHVSIRAAVLMVFDPVSRMTIAVDTTFTLCRWRKEESDGPGVEVAVRGGGASALQVGGSCRRRSGTEQRIWSILGRALPSPNHGPESLRNTCRYRLSLSSGESFPHGSNQRLLPLLLAEPQPLKIWWDVYLGRCTPRGKFVYKRRKTYFALEQAMVLLGSTQK